MDDDLVDAARVARIETIGRRSGARRRAVVGFVAEPDGSLLIAATDPAADWASNLLADPSVTVTIGARSFAAVATPLDGVEHARAVRELILRYGTPSEGLGSGPSFRLRSLD